MFRRFAVSRWTLPSVVTSLVVVAGCRDFVTGVARPTPVDVSFMRDTLRVGDSVQVVVSVHGGQDRIVTRPSVRLTVSDSAVARLSATWLVGRRAGQVIVGAESGGRTGFRAAVVR